MKLALIGYGRLGQSVHAVATGCGHEVPVIIDPGSPSATHPGPPSLRALAGIDVAIEATTPQAVLPNIEALAASGINTLVATTGWYDHLPQVQELVKGSGIGLLYAPNCSVGINVLFRLLGDAAALLTDLEDFDCFAYEIHHRGKRDSPSGTAKQIEQILLHNLKSKTTIVEDRLERRIRPEELQVASIRGGGEPGTHTVVFDSPTESLEIRHSVRSLEAFASGAVRAAEWLSARRGFYSFNDYLAERFGFPPLVGSLTGPEKSDH
jgi:4-hydroxy-tetrahydrodipicolinate reductase